MGMLKVWDGAAWQNVGLSEAYSTLKLPVVAATTANITLSGTQTIDSRACVAGDRVLVKNQTAPAENGIYVVASGAWARATDADTAAECAGAQVTVIGGTWAPFTYLTEFAITGTLGTSPMVWQQILTKNWGDFYYAPVSGAWTSWTPTITSGGAIGNATRTGGYVQIGKMVHFWGKIILGSTSTVTGTLVLTIPVTARAGGVQSSLEVLLTDTGTINNIGFGHLSSTTAITCYAQVSSTTYLSVGVISATAPFTWVTNDEIEYRGSYEAA